MFQGFNSDLLSFYADIRFHNEKAFMDAHRKEYYQKVRDPFYAFIAEMAPVMLSIDPDMEVRPAKCLSRINRDTRYIPLPRSSLGSFSARGRRQGRHALLLVRDSAGCRQLGAGRMG